MIRANRTPVVCGIDIGSTNTKVVALDADSQVVGRAQRRTPRDEMDLSIDASRVLDLVEQMLLEVCRDRFSIRGTCAAGVGEDGFPVDVRMRPLHPALAWFDPRRTRVFAALEPELLPSSGIGVADDAARTVVGWRWARDQHHLEGAAAWIALTDFIATAWTGRAFASDTIASRTAAWDGTTRRWIEPRVRVTLGELALLPQVLPAGAVVGRIVSARLSDAGVLADEAVAVAGGHDHTIGGWAVHQLDPGAVLDSMGTAEVVVAQTDQRVGRTPSVDVAPGIRSDGTSLLSVEEFTRNVDWASNDPAVAAEIRAMATGEREPNDSLLSDAFVAGVRGGGRPRYAVDAPADATSRASAVLGALARTGADAIEDVAALAPDHARVYVAGGWSRAEGWLAIKQRMSGRTMIVVHEPEVAAVGSALLAAGAVGWTTAPSVAFAATPGTDRRSA